MHTEEYNSVIFKKNGMLINFENTNNNKSLFFLAKTQNNR